MREMIKSILLEDLLNAKALAIDAGKESERFVDLLNQVKGKEKPFNDLRIRLRSL